MGRAMSATADLILTGGKVVSPDAVIDAAIAIKDGKILAVGAADAMPAAKETVDVSGMHVLPGTIAAAFGGVTTVFDMPNTIPTVGTADALTAKHKMASEKAHVDYGLYAVL